MQSFFLLAALLVVIASCSNSNTVDAFSAPTPILGIGAILFRPRNIKFIKSSESSDYINDIDMAGKFFVDAFW